jgi:3-deoxy-manno-octulosonate cytidylyltransferase (CMP-KDO synthetase)
MVSDPPDFVIVIPARYASERLPGKLLLDIHGRTLLEHVWRRAMQSPARQVVIATDDDGILQAAAGFGAEAVMTSALHRCGSDRIAECAALMGWSASQIIVNLQGDEPLMPPGCLEQVAALLADNTQADAASLYAAIDSEQELDNPNVVKVVTRMDGQALLFSRAAIPVARDFASAEEAMRSGVEWRRHLGLYAYRREALSWFSRTPATPLERTEKLEQLRFLEHGRRIVLAGASEPIPAGVDTQADLDRVRLIMK